MSDVLESVVSSVAASRRYRHVCADVVERLARRALAASGGDARAASKRTKSALHQVFGAFVAGPLDAGRVVLDLRRAAGDPVALRAALLRAMERHASTRERTPIQDELWANVAARLGPRARVLDLGCGLNPLAAPWMTGLGSERYIGLEIDLGLVELLRRALDVIGIAHDIRAHDLLADAPLPAADVVLAMKLLPTLEQQDRGAGMRVLESAPAPAIVATFPRQSLGGRGKGMTAHYATAFEAAATARQWRWERVELRGELVYVVWKSA